MTLRLPRRICAIARTVRGARGRAGHVGVPTTATGAAGAVVRAIGIDIFDRTERSAMIAKATSEEGDTVERRAVVRMTRDAKRVERHDLRQGGRTRRVMALCVPPPARREFSRAKPHGMSPDSHTHCAST